MKYSSIKELHTDLEYRRTARTVGIIALVSAAISYWAEDDVPSCIQDTNLIYQTSFEINEQNVPCTRFESVDDIILEESHEKN